MNFEAVLPFVKLIMKHLAPLTSDYKFHWAYITSSDFSVQGQTLFVSMDVIDMNRVEVSVNSRTEGAQIPASVVADLRSRFQKATQEFNKIAPAKEVYAFAALDVASGKKLPTEILSNIQSFVAGPAKPLPPGLPVMRLFLKKRGGRLTRRR